ncbi:MAG: hypothetical protein QGH45_20325 [Myxococcota bacterium]|jgi:hypothetical protein|nr:hypothetical protein [Myxococcota bacterium]
MGASFSSASPIGAAAGEVVRRMVDPGEQDAIARRFGATDVRCSREERGGDRLLIELYTEEPSRKGRGTERCTIEMEWDISSRTCRWIRRDHNHGDRVRVAGTLRVEMDGEGRSVIREQGEVEIGYPILGRRLARKVAGALERRAPEKAAYWERRCRD